jgi:predicted nucleotidyltransferase component of viral defense system
MKEPRQKNIPASIRQRLLDYARCNDDNFQAILTRYGAERFLYRLSRSNYSDNFVLKGASLFLNWTGEFFRPTKDLDFLSSSSHKLAELVEIIKKICSIQYKQDGIIFLLRTLHGERIREEQEYGGIRVKFEARLATAHIHMQLDIGYGDIVIPAPERKEFPTLLKLSPPVIQMYPPEAMIAEKLHALVSLGMANSRMKDFYDLWILANYFEFDGTNISRAIKATFSSRGSGIPEGEPLPLTPTYFEDLDKRTQWQAFLSKGSFKVQEEEFSTIIRVLRQFLLKPLKAVKEGRDFKASWKKGGPWQ